MGIGNDRKDEIDKWFKQKVPIYFKMKGIETLMTLKKNCQECGGKGTIRKILYGMPVKEPDASKYMLGGCVVLLGCDFDIGCCDCSWRSFSTAAKRREFEELTVWLAEQREKESKAKTSGGTK